MNFDVFTCVVTRPSFKTCYNKATRCITLLSSFYQWQADLSLSDSHQCAAEFWSLQAPRGSSKLNLAPPGSSGLLQTPPGSSRLLQAEFWPLQAPPGSSKLIGGPSTLLQAPPG